MPGRTGTHRRGERVWRRRYLRCCFVHPIAVHFHSDCVTTSCHELEVFFSASSSSWRMCEKHFRTYMQQQMANACRFGLVLALAAACSAAALGTYDAGRSSELAGELEALGLSSESIKVEATALAEWIVAVRRRLHKTPELMYDLAETASIVREVLDELGVPYRYPIASHGIVATIGSGKQPVIALRSDMDALPVHEVAMDGTDDFVSERPGKMHACGHDAHMAMLLGAAKLLKSREKALTGTVQLVFQPAEEGGAGGLAMLLEGVSDSTEKVKRMFGMHVWPWLPTGSFGMKSGPLMAGAGTFEVVIKGKGGHAAAGVGMGVVDPTVAAAAAVSSLQSIVARDVAPDDQAVVSVTMIHGGNAYNVVPDQVCLALRRACLAFRCDPAE